MLHEIIGLIDFAALADGLYKISYNITANAVDHLAVNTDFFLKEAKQACIDQVTTGTIDYEGILIRIIQKDANNFNNNYNALKKITKHFANFYFKGCATNSTYGDICYYRYGQVTMMALPFYLQVANGLP